ncbi:MAG: elongation factor 4 [Acidobacteria bacterium]|nr:MAG: elongation factor 4 [Acidobacteriota bacterium]
MTISHIRNFSIIAHIDHGKSTLADRILEKTEAIDRRDMKAQVLDDMDLERERGITIKAHSVTVKYRSKKGEDFIFNLIDTPGHVDFSYEVSRSLKACEGALLVVDASQGVEAQTLANTYLAIENDLEILPVLNKIDLPSAEPDRILRQIEQVIGLDTESTCLVSAKTGQGIDDVLESIVSTFPAPDGDPEAPLSALIFDSWFDPYRGVIMLVRVFEGSISPRMKIRLMASAKTFDVDEVGIFTPKMTPKSSLSAGEVGYVIAGIKTIQDSKIGDTITEVGRETGTALPGFQEMKPVVFSSFFPTDNAQYDDLRDAVEKLRLNDSAFVYEPETSDALGFGFRCGFLGLLHMEITQERLEREYGLELISTAPGVEYKLELTDGKIEFISNPSKIPEPQYIRKIEEPIVTATIVTRSDFVGNILKLCEERRGIQKRLEYVSEDRVLIEYELPLNEIVLDFYDKLKSLSKGYASFDYTISGLRASKLVKLDILVNGDPIDALSIIVHQDKSFQRGQALTRKMKELIPRQMYEVAIQAAIGRRIIARTTVKAMRKNVLAKCYGGDITRKRKLLEKQKAGKKRMKAVGRIQIPQDAFMAILKINDED